MPRCANLITVSATRAAAGSSPTLKPRVLQAEASARGTLAARSRACRAVSAERRASNSEICAVSVLTQAARVSRLLRARARSRLRVSTTSHFPNTWLLRIFQGPADAMRANRFILRGETQENE